MNDLELYIPTQINLGTIILKEKVAKKYSWMSLLEFLKHTIILYILRDFIPMYKEVHGINKQFHIRGR